MICITGDTHGEIGRFYEFHSKYGEESWDENDTLIVCGDFGYLFRNDKSENLFLDDLSRKPYSICFIDGNHENFDAINNYPVTEWHGGKVHQIRRNIRHLMRGQIFDIGGKSFFTMGGAYSVDKCYRTPGISWWQEELPDDAEYKEATRNLKAHGMKVDYILTHTLPREMIPYLGKHPDAHDAELTGFLEWVLHEVGYRHWYCGHWHEDRSIGDKLTVLWFDVVEIGKEGR